MIAEGAFAANLQNTVTGADTRVPGGAGGQHIADHARRVRQTVPVGDRRENHREQDVHDDPCGDDQHPLGHRFRGEATRVELDRSGLLGIVIVAHLDAVRFGFRIARVVVLAEHFHIAAERQNADAVLGFPPAEAGERPWQPQPADADRDIEADVELLALHPAGFRGEEVSQFVDENHQTKSDDGFDATDQHLRAQIIRQRCPHHSVHRPTSFRAQASSVHSRSSVGHASNS